jgi:hypothetical protein
LKIRQKARYALDDLYQSMIRHWLFIKKHDTPLTICHKARYVIDDSLKSSIGINDSSKNTIRISMKELTIFCLSLRSPEWRYIPESEKEDLGLTFDDDGEFWMSFKDFTQHFDRYEQQHDSPIRQIFLIKFQLHSEAIKVENQLEIFDSFV